MYWQTRAILLETKKLHKRPNKYKRGTMGKLTTQPPSFIPVSDIGYMDQIEQRHNITVGKLKITKITFQFLLLL